ncbi:MAG TPA: hypothetical protein DGM69_02165 [Chloroflexi bacterium]|nr:hypothetical protein [Chloroflexota bacterium]|tara:strand:+ start:3451 stop:3984 length:534 start_codon:yes stop_codon:yes gene_type:complete
MEIKTKKHTNKLVGFFVWCLLISLLVFVAIGMFQTSLGPLRSGKVPNFSLQTFDGKTYNLNELNGKIIVINFWASWCEPCKEEASDLEQIWLNYKSRDVILLGIGYADTKVEALDYLRTWNITYPNGPDIGTKISRLFRIRGVPETYIVSKDGYIIESFVGPVTYKTLTTILNKLLQ